MNPLRRLLAYFFPSAPAEQVQTTQIVPAPESLTRPFTDAELDDIAGVVDAMGSVGRRVKPCSPAPAYGEVLDGVWVGPPAKAPLDTSIEFVDAGGCAPPVAAPPVRAQPGKVPPILRKAALAKVRR